MNLKNRYEKVAEYICLKKLIKNARMKGQSRTMRKKH